MEGEKNIPDRITYSESRTINVGDYESIKTELRYSGSVRKINEKEQTLEVMADGSITIDEEKESFDDSADTIIERVRSILDAREGEIRIKTAQFTEHATEDKAMLLGIIDAKRVRRLRNEAKVKRKDIDALDSGNKEIFDDEE